MAKCFLRRFFNFINVFLLFHCYLSLKKGLRLVLHMKKLKFHQTSKRCFVPSSVEIGPVVLDIFLVFRNYLPLNLNPQYPWVLCAKFDIIWPSGYGEKMKMRKVYTHRRTDRRRTTSDQKNGRKKFIQYPSMQFFVFYSPQVSYFIRTPLRSEAPYLTVQGLCCMERNDVHTKRTAENL